MLRKTIFNSKNLSLLLSLGCLSSAFALPDSPTVASGDADFDYTVPMTLTVTANSDRTIVNWDSFSIDDSEITTFVLPDTTSAILNRVTGETASDIIGYIESNGSVYLINENGIIMGNNCFINTNTFLASTLDVDDTQFLDGGNMDFFTNITPGTAVTNNGTIIADEDIILLGYQVLNEGYGSLWAPYGTIALGASAGVTVQPTGDERILIVYGTAAYSDVTGVDSSVPLQSKIVELKADGAGYSLAINFGDEFGNGQITARDLFGTDSSVIFESVGGAINVNSTIGTFNTDGSGGPLYVLGDTITLDSSCYIETGGLPAGNIYIGGGLHGEDSNLINATSVNFTADAFIDASSSGIYDGGQVVVWADDTVTFCGSIYTEGALGSGGLVDFGGTNYLQYAGNVINVGNPDGDILLESNNIDTTPCGFMNH